MSVLLALLSSTGCCSALCKPFLTFRIGWVAGCREMSSTTCFHLAQGLFLRRVGKQLFSTMFSPFGALGNKLLLLGLPERKDCDWRIISFCVSIDYLMFNRKPCGHKLYEMGSKSENQVPGAIQAVIYLITDVMP